MHEVVSTECNIIWVKVSDKLTHQDYADLTANWAKIIAMHGKLRLGFNMENFSGWEPVAMWDDLKFSLSHASQIERVAMVGDKKWEEWVSKIAALMLQAEA